MLGWFPFIFDIASLFIWPMLAVKSFFVWRRTPESLRAITGLVAFTLIGILVTFLVGGTLLRQSANYLFLKTIRPEDVTGISIGDKSWTDMQDIERVTNSLNHAVWHKVSHDSGGPFVEMTISLHSGSIMKFYVGRYNDRDAALVERIYINNEAQLLTSGDSYILGLPTALKGLDYSLPLAEQGYTPGIFDYLILWFFIVIFVFIFWPKDILKRWLKAA